MINIILKDRLIFPNINRSELEDTIKKSNFNSKIIGRDNNGNIIIAEITDEEIVS